MADKKNNTVPIILGLAALGLLGYAAFGGDTTTADSNTLHNVPNGSTINTQWGTWQNTSGQPVWVTATGVIMNGASDILGNVKDILAALNQNNDATPDNSAPDATVPEHGIGSIFYSGYYYNPLPGGLM